MKNDFLSSDEDITQFSYLRESTEAKMAYKTLIEEEVSLYRPLEVGSPFLDKYTIVKVLGSGNFGMIYMIRANDASKKLLAVKEFFPRGFVTRDSNGHLRLKDPLSKEEEKVYQHIRNIFIGEAQNLVKVTKTMHPNIVTFFSLIENVNNTSYFIMNYEEGISLKVYLDQRREKEKPALSNYKIYDILMPLLDGLRQIHDVGVFHQDIKLENILIRDDGSPLLLDFGASTILYDKEKGKYFNATTIRYAAIEQIYLDNPPKINETTDIYGVGVLMYRIICNEFPIKAKDRLTHLIEKGNDPYVPLIQKKIKGYDNRLLRAVDKALSLEQEERFQNARDFMNALVIKKSPKKYFYFLFLFTFLYAIYYLQIKQWDMQITVTPKDAQILIDGKEISLDTHQKVKVSLGEHNITAKKPGYFLKKSTHTFNAFYNQYLNIILIPKEHTITIESKISLKKIFVNKKRIYDMTFIAKSNKSPYRIIIITSNNKSIDANLTYLELAKKDFKLMVKPTIQ